MLLASQNQPRRKGFTPKWGLVFSGCVQAKAGRDWLAVVLRRDADMDG
jgi:hypothetical protein